jgi:hypothetical protein
LNKKAQAGRILMDEKISPKAPDYYINTAPEMDALERAAADGKHGRHYQNIEHTDARVHKAPGASHSVLLELSTSERMAGLTTDTLEALTREQDADAALAFLYIAHLLAKPNSGTPQNMAEAVVSFDDVITKIGWDPRSSEERRLMHKRIFQFIEFGERAQVVGERRGKYKDKHTGEIVNTVIRSSIWRIHKTETPEQASLFSADEVPVSVEIAMSSDWTKLLTSPQTAQYLPLGELLGAIKGNKPSGAWARVIGLSLASFWRRLPRESMDGSIKPTRRELLDRYPPKTGSVEEVLASTNPKYALKYWHGALQILVESNFIERAGEALVTVEQARARMPRREWAQEWLDGCVDIQPKALMKEVILQRGRALPPIETQPQKRRKKGTR